MAHTLTAAPTRPVTGRTRAVAAWTVQLVLAAQFAAGGALKLTGDPAMVAMFADIGAGQWLRFVVGGLELAAAIGLLVPFLTCVAALGLVGLMVGAAVTNVALLGTGPAVPLALGIAGGVVAYLRRNDLRRLVHALAT